MSIEFVGIGDLHLDGKLLRHLPDLNSRIIHEVKRVLRYAKRNGIDLAVFYGDICETPEMSTEAARLLLKLIMEHSSMSMIFLLGNHDRENSETHSMQLFADLVAFEVLPNVKVIEKPTTLFRKSGTPLRLLPWPSLDTDVECLNVIHEEVVGSTWDFGRKSTTQKKAKGVCVAGHIHTSQTVGKVHYSGTLYQTTFGEKPAKYFHHVKWLEGQPPSVKKIPHVASFSLVNKIIASKDDLKTIEKDPNILYKVFVQDSVTLEADTFADLPNVVKVNSFRTKLELTSLIQEELRIDDEFEVTSLLSVENNLKTWLLSAEVDDDLRRKTYKKFKTLFKDKSL